MGDTKYLYGAAVQGIQGFIFQTNKLKEIVGASELVEQICTTAFNDYAKNGKSIVRAAGNIKYIFSDKAACEKAVREFPRKVMTMAPGITISQAVVTLKDDKSDYAEKSNELEKLLRAQRNKVIRPMNLGLMAISRAPSTGLPAIREIVNGDHEKELLDEASLRKIDINKSSRELAKKSFGNEVTDAEICYDIEDLTGKNSWIAVIHADGNGVGAIVESMAKNPGTMQKFSSTLAKITEDSAAKAFNFVKEFFSNEESYLKNKKIPIRPIVLGGDDLTLICRADLAIEYVKVFLTEFEKESKEQLKGIMPDEKSLQKGLTACAGIAFVKSSYPFHYAVHLAESLCGRAKKVAKSIHDEAAALPPSCLMFHKVQDSFIEDFGEIVKRELTPQEDLSFEYGPYYCGDRAEELKIESLKTIEYLLDKVQQLQQPGGNKEYNALKSNLRQWISLLFENKEEANQRMKRIRKLSKVARDYVDKEYEDVKKVKEIPFFDILSLASLNIETKK